MCFSDLFFVAQLVSLLLTMYCTTLFVQYIRFILANGFLALPSEIIISRLILGNSFFSRKSSAWPLGSPFLLKHSSRMIPSLHSAKSIGASVRKVVRNTGANLVYLFLFSHQIQSIWRRELTIRSSIPYSITIIFFFKKK